MLIYQTTNNEQIEQGYCFNSIYSVLSKFYEIFVVVYKRQQKECILLYISAPEMKILLFIIVIKYSEFENKKKGYNFFNLDCIKTQ